MYKLNKTTNIIKTTTYVHSASLKRKKYIRLVDKDGQFNANTQSLEDLDHLKDFGSHRLFRIHLATQFCIESIFLSVGVPHCTGVLHAGPDNALKRHIFSHG